MNPVDKKKSTPARAGRPELNSRQKSLIRLGVVIVLAVIAGLVAWLAIGGGSSKSPAKAGTVVSEQNLQTLAAALNVPVFWVGPQANVRYELDRRSNGWIYVRYLSGQMKAGTVKTLTVATYRWPYASTLGLARKKGWHRLDTGTGGVAAFINIKDPYSVHLASPGLNYQIEVYDPTAGAAAMLVQAGRTIQVTQGERLGLSLAALKKEIASLGQTVYWIGPQAGVTYELTRSPSGNVDLRYLPKGVAIGAVGVYPTVGTYPMSNATTATKAAAAKSGSVPVKLAGAVAFYSTSRPTSVYVAFKGSGYQVEVYNPVAASALAAVKSGLVKPVG